MTHGLPEICKKCFGWREDVAYYKNGKKYKYWKCMSCGKVEDGEVNIHVSEGEVDATSREQDS